MMTKGRRFTLLEITLAATLLAIIAMALTFQVRGMVAMHRFEKSVEKLYTDLKKIQIVALSSRGDFTLTIDRAAKGYVYRFTTDEPIQGLSRQVTLQEVESIEPLHPIHIYSSGRIDPGEDLKLIHKKGHGKVLVLQESPTIQLKKLEKPAPNSL